MKTLLQYPGGKRRLAPWIVSRMPAHHSYLEPYFGGGAVLFAKPAAPIETVNDLDGDVVNFFRVIRDEESRKKLVDWLWYTPYAREAYEESFKRPPRDAVERAGYFAVRSMQSHGFRLNENCGWKKDVHGREAAYALHNWNRLPESLGQTAARLKQVQIENRPALELIKAFNHENVLIYADPPYVLSTRSRRQYRYEMTDEEHRELLEELCRSRAKVMLSGYDCELYREYLGGWRKVQTMARTQSGDRRVETLWMNFEQTERQMSMKV